MVEPDHWPYFMFGPLGGTIQQADKDCRKVAVPHPEGCQHPSHQEPLVEGRFAADPHLCTFGLYEEDRPDRFTLRRHFIWKGWFGWPTTSTSWAAPTA